MPEGAVYECRINSVLASQKLATVWYFLQTDNDATGDPRDAVNEIVEDELITLIQAFTSFKQNFTSWETKGVGLVKSQAIIFPYANAGVVAQDTLAPNIVAVITEYSGALGRKGIGRSFYSGVPYDFVDEGQLNNDYFTLLLALGNKQDDQFTSATGGWKFRRCLYNKGTDTGTELVDHRVRARTTTLRSRTKGVGQ